MSKVSYALSKLSQVVQNLEGSTDHLETKLNGEQRDMFSAPAANGNADAIDKEAVAKKLDLAISKIEDILDEGEAAHG